MTLPPDAIPVPDEEIVDAPITDEPGIADDPVPEDDPAIIDVSPTDEEV